MHCLILKQGLMLLNLQAKLQAVQSNVRAAWDAGCLLHEDMLRLNKHLKKMGWDSQHLEKGV